MARTSLAPVSNFAVKRHAAVAVVVFEVPGEASFPDPESDVPSFNFAFHFGQAFADPGDPSARLWYGCPMPAHGYRYLRATRIVATATQKATEFGMISTRSPLDTP